MQITYIAAVIAAILATVSAQGMQQQQQQQQSSVGGFGPGPYYGNPRYTPYGPW